MAVCGDPKSRHGIILAKNEAAKQYGVQTAETLWQAKMKCPSLTLVAPHHDQYEKYSRLVNRIYEDYTDLVEPFGIDESWLDVSGTLHLFGEASKIADTIRRRVKEELGITVSVGVSFNKVFAKLGSDYKKPDATTVITRFNYKEIVHPLPVGQLLYVGRSAQKTLGALGIRTIGQLADTDRKHLSRRLGKLGEMIHDYANGIDPSPVRRAQQERKPKSIGNGITFPRDLFGIADIRPAVLSLCDMVAVRLRCQGLSCATLCVTIKYPDFKSISRQRTLSSPTRLAKELAEAALDMLREADALHTPIRMLTVTASHLDDTDENCRQLSLFDTADAPAHSRQLQLETAMDNIRKKYSTAKEGLGLITLRSKKKKEP
jgi:DNA polymerase-4